MTTHTSDHEIMIGTTTRRLNLLRDSNDKAMYSVTEVVPNHLDKILYSQNNWIGGHGNYKTENPTMYFDGQSIDTTQDGRILLGPKIKEIYSSAATNLKENYGAGADNNGGCYGATWLTMVFTAAASYSLDSVTVTIGKVAYTNPGTVTLSIRATSGSLPTGADLATSTIDGNTLANCWTYNNCADVNFPLETPVAITNGTEYAIVLKAPSASSGNAVWWEIDTSNGYATGQAGYSSNSGTSWTANATYDYYFKCYAAASTAMSSTPTCFFWSTTAAKWLCADSAKIYYYNGNMWMPATTVVANVTSFAEYNGYIFAAIGTGTAYVYSADGDTWTTCTLTSHHATNFLSAPNAPGTANVLWKALTPNQLTSNTSGINGGDEWSSIAYIGDTTNNITNIFLSGDNLMVGRTDNLYRYEADGSVHALMDDLKVSRSTQNFKYVCNWQGNTYFSVSTGLYELTTYNTLNKIGPLQDTGDIDKVGTVCGLTSDVDYLYVAMAEGTVTHIYKGRPKGNIWSWCPLIYLGANNCVAIGIAQHSVTDKRLWFGYGTHTGYVYISDNPTADDNARFAASGWIRFSWDYGTDPYYNKLLQSVVTQTENCTANITVQPKYRKDSETSMTNLTAAITTNGIVRTNLTTALSANRIQYEVDLATNDSTLTPVIRSFEVNGHEKPTLYRLHDCTYDIGTDPANKTSTVRSFLRGGRTTTGLIKFADLRYGDYISGTAGTNYVLVVMEPGYPQEIEYYNEKNQQTQLGIKVVWKEVSTVYPADSAYLPSLYCDTGSVFPSGPVIGQFFLHNTTGRMILYQYDGTNWIPIQSYGTMTIYVDGTNGTDDLTHGTATGTSAFKTITYAWDAIPPIVNNVYMYIATGTYNESVNWWGKYNASGIIYIYGTLPSPTNLTATGGTIGTALVPPTVTGTFTAAAHDKKFIKFTSGTNDGTWRVIGQTTITNLYLEGNPLPAAPANGNTYSVYDLGSGTILNGDQQVFNSQRVQFYYIKFTNSAFNTVCMWSTVYDEIHMCYLQSSSASGPALQIGGSTSLEVYDSVIENTTTGYGVWSENSASMEIFACKIITAGGVGLYGITSAHFNIVYPSEISGCAIGGYVVYNGAIYFLGGTCKSYVHGNSGQGLNASAHAYVAVSSSNTYGKKLDGTADANGDDEYADAVSFSYVTS
jgi:hypothetical protein